MFGVGVTEAIILGVICFVPVVAVVAGIIVVATRKKDSGND